MFNKDFAYLEDEIKKKGYAIISLLPLDKITDLNNDSNILLNSIDNNLLVDTFLSAGRIDSIETRNASSLSLKKNIVPFIENIFCKEEAEIVSGVHLFKSPGNSSSLNPHQDSSLIDERNHISYYVWVPFQETNEENGTLSVIPGSHKLSIYQRSLNIPWSLEEYGKILWKFMIPININLGEAVIFHSALIHGSSSNKTSSMRIAANFFIKPKDALYLHYYTDAESNFNKIEVYSVTPEFYLSCDIMKRPANKFPLIKTEFNSNTLYSKNEILDFCIKQRKDLTDEKLNLKYKIPFFKYF